MSIDEGALAKDCFDFSRTRALRSVLRIPARDWGMEDTEERLKGTCNKQKSKIPFANLAEVP